ncbi:MAG: RNA methyltransferase [Candidatus Cloacimonetes bacterium]|nr:RNA methyltransferase [Candidatus Cloacimonadota bacterium]
MNQIVISEDEITNNTIEILSTDTRYKHLTTVLKPKVGAKLKACILNQGHTQLILHEVYPQKLVFTFDQIQNTKHNNLNLIVGLSRPPSMKKLLEHGSCMGVTNFTVAKTKLSEKSFLQSKVFHDHSISTLLNLGLSQSVQHYKLPSFDLSPDYKQVSLSNFSKANRFILCPSADLWLSKDLIDFNQDITLAIGCERGFTKQEEEHFQEYNFIPIKISNSILRVEIAVYSILSQIELLRNQYD